LKTVKKFKHSLVRLAATNPFWLASIVVGCASIFFAQLADTMGFLQKAWFAHFAWIYIVLAPFGVGLLVCLTEKFFVKQVAAAFLR